MLTGNYVLDEDDVLLLVEDCEPPFFHYDEDENCISSICYYEDYEAFELITACETFFGCVGATGMTDPEDAAIFRSCGFHPCDDQGTMAKSSESFITLLSGDLLCHVLALCVDETTSGAQALRLRLVSRRFAHCFERSSLAAHIRKHCIEFYVWELRLRRAPVEQTKIEWRLVAAVASDLIRGYGALGRYVSPIAAKILTLGVMRELETAIERPSIEKRPSYTMTLQDRQDWKRKDKSPGAMVCAFHQADLFPDSPIPFPDPDSSEEPYVDYSDDTSDEDSSQADESESEFRIELRAGQDEAHKLVALWLLGVGPNKWKTSLDIFEDADLMKPDYSGRTPIENALELALEVGGLEKRMYNLELMVQKYVNLGLPLDRLRQLDRDYYNAQHEPKGTWMSRLSAILYPPGEIYVGHDLVNTSCDSIKMIRPGVFGAPNLTEQLEQIVRFALDAMLEMCEHVADATASLVDASRVCIPISREHALLALSLYFKMRK